MPADALKCKECSTTYPADARYVCERCFGPLEAVYDAPQASPDELRRRIQAGPHTIWRYSDFLPVDAAPRTSLPTGWTPLVRADRLAERLGLREVWIKDERANPTHSTRFATGIADLTPGRPARLLDLVEGRSGIVLAAWLAEQDPAWRAGIATASLDPFRGYATP